MDNQICKDLSAALCAAFGTSFFKVRYSKFTGYTLCYRGFSVYCDIRDSRHPSDVLLHFIAVIQNGSVLGMFKTNYHGRSCSRPAVPCAEVISQSDEDVPDDLPF